MSMMRIGLQMQATVGYLACGTAFFIRSSSTHKCGPQRENIGDLLRCHGRDVTENRDP
jgi:hypothetical protein